MDIVTIVTIEGTDYLQLTNPRNSCTMRTGAFNDVDCDLYDLNCVPLCESLNLHCTNRIFLKDTKKNRTKYVLHQLEGTS